MVLIRMEMVTFRGWTANIYHFYKGGFTYFMPA